MSISDGLVGRLVILIAGLAIGKAWERYKLRDGKWIDAAGIPFPSAICISASRADTPPAL